MHTVYVTMETKEGQQISIYCLLSNCFFFFQILSQGIVKPDIVFFGEDLPHKFYALRYADLSQCDLLIVMGTSLEVRINRI